jgi:hypothetical protein
MLWSEKRGGLQGCECSESGGSRREIPLAVSKPPHATGRKKSMRGSMGGIVSEWVSEWQDKGEEGGREGSSAVSQWKWKWCKK